jgi:hypothetical protein
MMRGADGSYDVFEEVVIRSLARDSCNACSEIIARGHYYVRITSLFEGRREKHKQCLRCHYIWRVLVNARGYGEWPCERLRCGEEWEDVFFGEPPEGIERLAFVEPEELQFDIESEGFLKVYYGEGLDVFAYFDGGLYLSVNGNFGGAVIDCVARQEFERVRNAGI